MKCKSSVIFCVALLLLVSEKVAAQPDYVFKNPVLLSGTHLTTGAQYRFANVKIGVDAIVTVSDISPNTFLEEIDYFGGYDDALETKVNVMPLSTGYVEFDIRFVHAGSFSAFVQDNVSAAAIDIDGQDEAGRPLYEFDELNLNVSHAGQQVDYVLTGHDITVSTSGDWARGISNVASPKPGIDITALSAMFGVTNHHISALKYRVGVENHTWSSQVRLKSLYFKDLFNLLLPVDPQPKGKTSTTNKGAGSGNLLTVYPNPVQPASVISIYAEKEQPGEISLYDIGGKAIRQKYAVRLTKGNNSIPLANVSQLPKGIYTLVVSATGKILITKIVKQ